MKNIFIIGPISPSFIAESIAKHAQKRNIGAHNIFLGQVRNDVIGNKEVTAIEYSAYEPMANEIIHKMREDIFLKYDLICLHIYHSIGIVQAGEISLFVFTSSMHRSHAIKSCDEIVNFIKKNLAVWGKEIFSDKTETWKTNI